MWAAHAGRIDNVKVLLNHKADVNVANSGGGTALALATSIHRQDIVDLLVAAGETSTPTKTAVAPPAKPVEPVAVAPVVVPVVKPTTLAAAIAQNDADAVQTLIKHGADPNAPGPDGITPLIASILANDTKIMDTLLKNGAKTGLGTTPVNELPIMYAAVSSDPATLDFLITHGADVNQRDSEDSTALLWAAHAGRLDNVEVLLKRKADPNTHNVRNNTATSLASLIHRDDIIQVLQKAGETN